MSLFEYDEGHLIPAQFGHPVGGEAQEEILDSVRRQVLEVISRPLFPVTWNDMSVMPVAGMPESGEDIRSASETRGESPRLTALDGSGQVVLVEVISKLDATSLMNALARLGSVSNLGWNDLASAYPGGVAAFRSGWTQFRDAMPPNLAAGPRLILVSTEIDPSVRSALDALTTSGLEVHHVSVREMSNGRRFLDVQRVAASLFTHEPNLLAGRAARMPALNSAADADIAEPDTTSSLAAPQPPEEKIAAAVHPSGTGSADFSEIGAGAETTFEADQEIAAVEDASLQTGSISRRSIMESAQSSPVSPLAQGGDEEPVYSLFTSKSASEGEEDSSFADILFASEPDMSKPVRQRHGHRAKANAQTLTRGANARHETAVQASTNPVSVEEPETEGNGLLKRDAIGLQAIAQVTGEDTALYAVLQTERGSLQVQAVLEENGMISLEGREFTSPAQAASSLGLESQVLDGWDLWHLGLLEGPTLEEARREINVEIERESK